MATAYDLFFGAASAGGAPTFATFKDTDTSLDLTPPTITDLGGGFYRFSVDWSSIGATNIRYAVTLTGYPDQWDEIASPSVAAAAAVALVPASTTINTALYSSAATVINRTAVQCGFDQASDPWASTDQAFVLLRELLSSVGDDLLKYEWTHLVRSVSLTTDSSTAYQLPADFRGMVDQTFWNRSTRLPAIGPLSFQQSTAIQARLVNIVLNITFQIQGGVLTFPIVPPSGATATFSYLSNYWVLGTGHTDPNKRKPSASDDLLLFDEELLVLGLKLRYLEEKGFDTTQTQARYDSKLDDCLGRNVGGAVLSLGGGPRGAFDRMVNARNLPEGNW